MVENLVEISGRSQLYDLEESSPNALKSDKSTNKNGIVNIMCLILLRFYDIMNAKAFIIYYFNALADTQTFDLLPAIGQLYHNALLL